MSTRYLIWVPWGMQFTCMNNKIGGTFFFGMDLKHASFKVLIDIPYLFC